VRARLDSTKVSTISGDDAWDKAELPDDEIKEQLNADEKKLASDLEEKKRELNNHICIAFVCEFRDLT